MSRIRLVFVLLLGVLAGGTVFAQGAAGSSTMSRRATSSPDRTGCSPASRVTSMRLQRHAARVFLLPLAGVACRSDAEARRTHPERRAVWRLPLDRNLVAGHALRSRTGPRNCASCHNGRAGARQIAGPRADGDGLQRLSRLRGLESSQVRPLRHHGGVRDLPRRQPRRRSRRTAPADDGSVRLLPRLRWLVARATRRSRAGRRRLRLLPRRRPCGRTPSQPHSEFHSLRHLPLDHGLAAGAVRSPGPGGALRQLPRRRPSHRRRRAAHQRDRRLRCLHATTAWQPATRVDHGNVLGSCSSCHDGSRAAGQHVNHVVTRAECDNCHATTAWLPAKFDHTGTVGNCVQCHDGVRADGKAVTHLRTSDVCEACTWSRPGHRLRASITRR